MTKSSCATACSVVRAMEKGRCRVWGDAGMEAVLQTNPENNDKEIAYCLCRIELLGGRSRSKLRRRKHSAAFSVVAHPMSSVVSGGAYPRRKVQSRLVG